MRTWRYGAEQSDASVPVPSGLTSMHPYYIAQLMRTHMAVLLDGSVVALLRLVTKQQNEKDELLKTL